MVQHFNNSKAILQYLTANPIYVAAFTAGEGCFTAYIGLEPSNTWGIQISFEFSITQNSGDINLLEAFKLFFKVGNVYDRKDGCHAFAVRNLFDLKNVIIPFFLEYPLIGTKSYEFEKFMLLLDLMMLKSHIGKNPEHRDVLIKMALMIKDLNSKLGNDRKQKRNEFIVSWLQNLTNFPPTKEEKIKLKEYLHRKDNLKRP